MRPILLLAVLLAPQHVVVPARAGLVTHIDGRANYSPPDLIPQGARVVTEKVTWLEIMLNPDSYLWMADSTEVVLESTELRKLDIRLVRGSIAIAADHISRRSPITLRVGSRVLRMTSPGFYRFNADEAHVHLGQLAVEEPKGETVKKGWSAQWEGSGVRYNPIDYSAIHPLERFSRDRIHSIYAPTRRIEAQQRAVTRSIQSEILDLWDRSSR